MRTQIFLTTFEESFFSLVPRRVRPLAPGDSHDSNPVLADESLEIIEAKSVLDVFPIPAGTVTVTYQARPHPVST